MIFGPHVKSADTAATASWISQACGGADWTVGALVPNHYPFVLRVSAPESGIQNWWSAYRDLFGVIASVGELHTSSPERAWLAVWDGHGFDSATTQKAQLGRLDDETSQALKQERSRLSEDDERRNTAIRRELAQVVRFDLPTRTYYLLTGPVSAAITLSYPGSAAMDGLNPDLFWPDDRRWFVATDVDFWSIYVGGDHDFVSEVARNVGTDSELVAFNTQLEVED